MCTYPEQNAGRSVDRLAAGPDVLAIQQHLGLLAGACRFKINYPICHVLVILELSRAS
jgi:hypothetical protein